jgi:hypothetical protein
VSGVMGITGTVATTGKAVYPNDEGRLASAPAASPGC